MISQPGLKWRDDVFFGPQPYWTVEPCLKTIERLARRHLNVIEGHPCEVAYFNNGAFNKVYTIVTQRESFMMRVSLPVDLHFKVLSEVATINFIIAYDVSYENELGFEWVLTELIPGKRLDEQWTSMSWEAKEILIKQLVDFSAQLFCKQYSATGNLYNLESIKSRKQRLYKSALRTLVLRIVVHRIVSIQFFPGDRVNQEVSRGPFLSSRDWLAAQLRFITNDAENVLRELTEENSIKDAEAKKMLAERLFKQLPEVFADPGISEPTALVHDDLGEANILVDDAGALTAVLDWEFVSVVPLWRVCQLPYLFKGATREESLVKEEYAHDEQGEVNECYWDYRVFFEEIERVEPEWVRIHKSSTMKENFYIAVNDTAIGMFSIRTTKWLDQLEAGGEVESIQADMHG
ncbi:hypothetical protein AOQ84DRAFT_399299 [Glonium stellatum]|uniref:Aminoglycoside phosphotransferase domain-containing protein n=1 Tax=Glonium stellatum TaxID=574774 RepID=A0A8E2EW14_9PEZI|nr:hypothetical protein AOQ84DRAFT_399299 [Glonium stellatum]